LEKNGPCSIAAPHGETQVKVVMLYLSWSLLTFATFLALAELKRGAIVSMLYRSNVRAAVNLLIWAQTIGQRVTKIFRDGQKNGKMQSLKCVWSNKLIENEVKYVLSLSSYEAIACEFPECTPSSLHQGYDDRGARFRKEISGKSVKCTFNYKVCASGLMEEFEMQISNAEFERCYSICNNKLEKKRYTVKDSDQNTWDIDFFFDDGQLYFAMAECELLNFWDEKPKEVLKFVSDNELYQVPAIEFLDYSSYKISDVHYAKNQLTFLQNGIR
jgi:CYTH domain-containing protein